jgi:mono/diheme cytochrome c family protein
MKPLRVLLLAAATAAISLGAGDAQAGKALFAKACRACHGAQGQGNPAIAKAQNVTIRDLSSKEIQSMSDEELTKKAFGGYGKKKPVKTVTKEQMPDVIAFVRTLAK